jgi:hypothetical protein
MPAATIDPAHELGQALRVADPLRGAAFVEAAIVDQLDRQAAQAGDLAKHFSLQVTGHVPGLLAAHGGVEGEDEPPLLAGGERRRKGARTLHEGVNLVA